MTDERAVQLAMKLHLLGISRAGVIELLSQYSYDLIEEQISYLPYRKAKRPGAFLMDAVRNSYSPPKELFYAPPQTKPSAPADRLDEGSQRPS